METVFDLSGLLTIPFWMLIIFLPTWSVTQRIMSSVWVVAPAAILYCVLVLPSLPTILPALMRPELTKIAGFLAEPAGATAAWVHFLAFDLFVGRWVYLDSRERDMSPWIVSPMLFFVLMMGPFGAMLYLSAREIVGRGPSPSLGLPDG